MRTRLRTVRDTSLLVITTPICHNSCPNLLGRLFSLVSLGTLVGAPILLTTANNDRQRTLILSRRLQPLFDFFRTLALPINICTARTSFTGCRVADRPLGTHVHLTTRHTTPLFNIRPGGLLGVTWKSLRKYFLISTSPQQQPLPKRCPEHTPNSTRLSRADNTNHQRPQLPQHTSSRQTLLQELINSHFNTNTTSQALTLSNNSSTKSRFTSNINTRNYSPKSPIR